MMNGSQRGPAKTRTPSAEPPRSSFRPNETVSPLGVVHVPSCATDFVSSPVGVENIQSKTSSSSATVNGAGSLAAPGVSGRNRNR